MGEDRSAILALDLASVTGWAESGGLSGVQSFYPRRGDSPGMRWVEFRAWLNRLLDSLPEVGIIGYEQCHHRGGAATHVAHSLIALVETVAAERGLELTNRHASSIKKHAVGRGNASKDEMLGAARRKWPDVDIADDNQADALWLLNLLMAELGLG